MKYENGMIGGYDIFLTLLWDGLYHIPELLT